VGEERISDLVRVTYSPKLPTWTSVSGTTKILLTTQLGACWRCKNCFLSTSQL